MFSIDAIIFWVFVINYKCIPRQLYKLIQFAKNFVGTTTTYPSRNVAENIRRAVYDNGRWICVNIYAFIVEKEDNGDWSTITNGIMFVVGIYTTLYLLYNILHFRIYIYIYLTRYIFFCNFLLHPNQYYWNLKWM